jgi:hypothetical protein
MYGSALSMSLNSFVYISNSEFMNNLITCDINSDDFGGTIYINSGSVLECFNCTLKSNRADCTGSEFGGLGGRGGGILVNLDSKISKC